MKARAFAEIHDNGEVIRVELPAEQDLLDRIYELGRDADIAIGRWKTRHASVSSALSASAIVNVVLIAAHLWRSL